MKRSKTSTRAHRSRPLTLAQEILLIGAAFVTGGLLQIFVILHFSGILD